MNLHVVEETEYHTENHVHNPYDNRHLHFVGVQESQLVRGNIPDLWVKEKGERKKDKIFRCLINKRFVEVVALTPSIYSY